MLNSLTEKVLGTKVEPCNLMEWISGLIPWWIDLRTVFFDFQATETRMSDEHKVI